MSATADSNHVQRLHSYTGAAADFRTYMSVQLHGAKGVMAHVVCVCSIAHV